MLIKSTMDFLERFDLEVLPWPPQPSELNISKPQKTKVCLTETEKYDDEEE